jgi:hypothetical protein
LVAVALAGKTVWVSVQPMDYLVDPVVVEQ